MERLVGLVAQSYEAHLSRRRYSRGQTRLSIAQTRHSIAQTRHSIAQIRHSIAPFHVTSADSTLHCADSTLHRADSTLHRADSTLHRADSTLHCADSTHFAISIHYRPLRRLIVSLHFDQAIFTLLFTYFSAPPLASNIEPRYLNVFTVFTSIS